jgi:hypothetical protein
MVAHNVIALKACARDWRREKGVSSLGICLTGEIAFEVKKKHAGYGKGAKRKRG